MGKQYFKSSERIEKKYRSQTRAQQIKRNEEKKKFLESETGKKVIEELAKDDSFTFRLSLKLSEEIEEKENEKRIEESKLNELTEKLAAVASGRKTSA